MRRLLQSQLVVGILSLVAVVMVARSIMTGVRPRPAGGTSRQPQPAPVVETPQTPRQPTPTNQLAPTPMNLPEVLRLWQSLSGVTNRDPFFKPETNLAVAATNRVVPAGDKFTVNAIWDQGSGRSAVVNGRIIREGEQIYDYTVKKISRYEVVLSGPAGEETLRMGTAPHRPPAGGQK